MWLSFLNIFFFVFHTAFTLFNICGWAFRTTRRWQLVTIGLTAFNWFILGIWHGWGFCYCTEWHWQVRRALGLHDQSRSYIHFLIQHLTGINLPERMVEMWTLIIFLAAALAGILLNVRDYKRRRSGQSNLK